MTMEVKADSFTIERRLKASRTTVFQAWADPKQKAKWFAGADVAKSGYTVDFRPGGREYASFSNEMGLHENETCFFKIVPDALIVYAYSMAMNGNVHSVSLVTVRLEDDTTGTRLTYSEQMSVIGDSDGAAGREHGWGLMLDRMVEQVDAVHA
ncbi:SRPBCC domain-containing protein [Pelagibacterium lentulum]|uniref:Activator of Hsp90 ATPase homologue 1/2-like C-terminal domain-containing protein n=1 Tax=Pelagibacterium lentulum TaxID=2029865 RepID=A0A916RQS5_9HYPH|nr:SRPBCC domain-containing protein [Pelagibacterium lentulum]GGA63564.1 hypothetical protein GCM10011499_37390 [Pelagibacterium lentulum]